MYHDHDTPGGLPIDKEIERMGDDRPSADAAVLLGAFGMAAGPLAATGGYDHHTAGMRIFRLHFGHRPPVSKRFEVV
jgi:hypothetical protein